MLFFERSGWRIFRLAGVDVSISAGFLIIMALIVLWPGLQSGFTALGLAQGLIWILALAVSIIIHEFGHAIPCKVQNLEPSILLHGFGGLCFHQPAETDAKDLLIVVSGPLLQIAVGVLVWVVGALAVPDTVWASGPGEALLMFGRAFIYFSIFWGGLNLLVPMFPLDGGRLLHLVLRRFVAERKADEWALKVSIGAAAIGLPLALYFRSFLIAFVLFSIISDNWRALQSGVRLLQRRGREQPSGFLVELVEKAEACLEEGDFAEAARLCHQARAERGHIPPKTLDRIWTVLGLATLAQGDAEEASAYLKRVQRPDERVREVMEQLEQG